MLPSTARPLVDETSASYRRDMTANARRRPRLLVRIALVAAIFVAMGYALGFKTVWAFSERLCPPNYVEYYPIGMHTGGFWLCQPLGVTPPPGDVAWWNNLPSGYREQRVGAYFANIQVRVFEYDNVSGGPLFVGFNVPEPAY
jgi:hypothetical protein